MTNNSMYIGEGVHADFVEDEVEIRLYTPTSEIYLTVECLENLALFLNKITTKLSKNKEKYRDASKNYN